eukprot:2492172-Amphidinium_carterae.1
MQQYADSLKPEFPSPTFYLMSVVAWSAFDIGPLLFFGLTSKQVAQHTLWPSWGLTTLESLHELFMHHQLDMTTEL